jgi:hypothetical protein
MSFNVRTTAPFEKQAKRLKKKFPSLKTELAELVSALMEYPETGTALGNDCYKIRLAIASKGKGKSGGARVITLVEIKDTVVTLLYMYDKSEQSDISDKELLRLLESTK